MKRFYLFLLILSTIKIFGQDVYFTLSNPRLSNENGDYFYYTDVILYSNMGFKLGSGQLYFNYDTSVFGQNIFNNGNIEILMDANDILGKIIGSPPLQFNFYNDFITNDNTNSRVSFSWQHSFSKGCLDTVNIDYYSGRLFTLKIKFKQGQMIPEPDVCIESGVNFVNQTYTLCGPDPCNVKDCYNYPGVNILNDIYSCSDCKIVYSTADSGVGTLRNALDCALPGDTIRFAQNLHEDSIKIVSAVLDVQKDVYIVSKRDFNIVVDASGTDKVFNIYSGNTALIEGLHCIAGSDVNNSGIENNGSLTLKEFDIYFDAGSNPASVIKNNDQLNIVGLVSLKVK